MGQTVSKFVLGLSDKGTSFPLFKTMKKPPDI